MTRVGEAIVLVFFFFLLPRPQRYFNWLVIEVEKRGAVGLDFHLIFGF